MKGFLAFLLITLCFLIFNYTFATEINSGESGEGLKISEKMEGNNLLIESGNKIKKEEQANRIHEQEAKTEKLPEEGANVDTSITEKNYSVETPTIVLLVLFGILMIASFILIMMKI